MTDYQIIQPLFLLTETPLHAGSGDSLDIVDLPIQRERHTGFPKIESSSLKGALREAMETKVASRKFAQWDDADVKVHRIFGFDEGSLSTEEKSTLKKRFEKTQNGVSDPNTEFSGCLKITDARLLLFPVKSIKGVFAWVTCPRVLAQLELDMRLTDPTFAINGIPTEFGDNECYLLNLTGSKLQHNGHIVLEEYTFKVKDKADIKVSDTNLTDWLKGQIPFENDWWKNHLNNNVVLLSDSDFSDFVKLSTEVITRIKIDNNTGTVAQGALFSEEYLPVDSVLYSILIAETEFSNRPASEKMNNQAVMRFVQENLPKVFQLGGNATIGKGLLKRSQLPTYPSPNNNTEHEQHQNN
jgi:CRISPR-associated protein Cmr4